MTQLQSHYSFYSFGTRLKWLKIVFCFCSENFEQQSWKTKLENWHEPSNKFHMTGFYMEKKFQIYRESPQVFDPYISAIIRLVVDSVTKPVFCCKSRYSPAPILWNSLLSFPYPHLMYWGTVFQTHVEQIATGFHPSALLPCSPSL